MQVRAKSLSRVRLFVTLWTVACQAPVPTGSSRQEYWSGLLRPSSGVKPGGFKPTSLTYPALADGFFTPCTAWEAYEVIYTVEML